MKLLSGNSGNSILLAIVKVLSVLSGIFSTMIVSHALDLELYGTFSQTMLIVTTATSLSALGLADAANFFYNKTADEAQQKRYVNTILGIQYLVGVLTGLLILVSSKGLIAYFDNPLLASYICLIVLRPLFANVNCSLQHLVVSIGKARSVALRNGIFALLRIAAFAAAAYILKDISVILVIYLLFEILITILFSRAFQNKRFHFAPLQIDWKLLREIFVYCIPMGVYVLTSALARDVDKMLIGGMFSTDRYAIYANCSMLLPFDIVSSAFLTVLVPILTRYFGTGDYEKGQCLFKNYLKIGYYTSFTFTVACMILSREMILFLYGEKYLPGQTVFILYTVVDMVKFANLSIVLSACGRTKTLMLSSLAALIGNAVLNLLFVELFGFIGPALATVLVTVCLTGTLTQMSAQALHTNILRLLDWKELGVFILELILISAGCSMIRAFLQAREVHYFLILIIVGGAFVLTALLLNKKNIMEAIRKINGLK